MKQKLSRNIAKCLTCQDTIESTYRHDFKWCNCGNLAVDGGIDYTKRNFRDGMDSWEELSEYENAE